MACCAVILGHTDETYDPREIPMNHIRTDYPVERFYTKVGFSRLEAGNLRCWPLKLFEHCYPPSFSPHNKCTKLGLAEKVYQVMNINDFVL